MMKITSLTRTNLDIMIEKRDDLVAKIAEARLAGDEMNEVCLQAELQNTITAITTLATL